MNIVPISSMSLLQDSPLGAAGPVQDAGSLPFQKVFQNALNIVEETQAVKSQDSYNLALGEVDNLAAIQINSERATVAVQMMVEMRNRILEAYNEVMRINA